MNAFNLQQIADKLGVQLIQSNSKSSIEYLLTDSRTLTFAPATCFFALVSDRNNGHKYIYDLYEKGVRNFVVSEEIELQKIPDASVLNVENTIDALHQFALEKRKTFKGLVVAITGSNGKTIVKEWLYQVLQKQFYITRSPKSFNSQIGVSLSLWNMDPNADLMIVEAGISLPGEMEKLERIIQPDIVLFTNLGPAHQENFSSVQQKAAEKSKLAKNAKQVYYCRDYEVLKREIEAIVPDANQHAWSAKDLGKITATTDKFHDYSAICLVEEADTLLYTIPFTDDASIENSLHVCLLSRSLGMPADVVAVNLAKLEPVEMRLNMKNGINGCKIINDTYNSDIHSLGIAIDFLVQQSSNQSLNKTLILSDIQQSGIANEELYAEVSRLINSKHIDRLIGIGPSVSHFLDKVSAKTDFYATTQSFIENFQSLNFSDEVVLLKGAREFQFEQISTLLEVKMNKTTLEINLNAVLHNFHFYKSLLKPSTKVMGMVKAFAYGSGSLEIARMLQYHGCDYLAVAVADEGVELRKAGIKIPIIVLATERDAFHTLIAYNLEPEIYSFSILADFIFALRKRNIKEYPIHLKVDTGMHRFGFMPNEIDRLQEALLTNKEIKVQSVFSHLAASDDSKMDEFTNSQVALFNEITTQIESFLGYSFLKHILNSSGVERFTHHQLGMVRLGIGLYGVSTLNKSSLRHVATFKTNIAQIREVAENQSIGYSRVGWTKRESKIATIPVGYADGLDRRLSNGVGAFLVNGKKVPVIGNVCMDLTMIDITDVDAIEGDEVILMGDALQVEEWAAKMQTIPYEVLTNISQRVKRIYVTE